MKRNAIFAVCAILICASALTGCKVGEEDPLLSFRSRTARITGTWKLSDLQSTEISSYTSGGSVITTTQTRTYGGTLMTETDGTGNSETYSYSEEMTINEDGTYHQELVEDGYQFLTDGYWWWLDDAKDQARIAFDDDYSSMDIIQLKNKEVIFVAHRYVKLIDDTGDFDETTLDLRATYTKE